MTGLGVGTAKDGKTLVRAEIRAVNHRFLDVVFRMPPTLGHLEIKLRKQISEAIDRGRVTLSLDIEHDQSAIEVKVNEAFVEGYLDARRKLARRHGLPEDASLAEVLAHPDAIDIRERSLATRQLDALVAKAAEQAIDRMQQMRDREGKALQRDLRRRLKAILKEARQLRKLAASAPHEQRSRLEARLAKLGAADAVDPARLAAEVALLADKASIAEEIERLTSHVDQFGQELSAKGPVAKRLNFLLQEMHREVNTTGSKSTQLAITKSVLRLKEEIENMREQVQNLE